MRLGICNILIADTFYTLLVRYCSGEIPVKLFRSKNLPTPADRLAVGHKDSFAACRNIMLAAFQYYTDGNILHLCNIDYKCFNMVLY